MSDPREQRMNQLLLRGHATVAEIMRADFGEWPPKGLDLAVEPKQDVQLLPIWSAMNEKQFERFEEAVDGEDKTKKMKPITKFAVLGILKIFQSIMAAGAVISREIEPERIIYLNSLLSSHKASTTGHEATHVMQMDHSEASKDSETKTISNEILMAFWKAAKKESFTRRIWKGLRGKKNEHDIEQEQEKVSVGYYQKGEEIQARIHQVLAAGYSKWGCVPTTKEELWAALIAGGIKPPKEVIKILKQSSNGKAALEKFKTFSDFSEIWANTKNGVKMALAWGGVTLAFTAITGLAGPVSLPALLLAAATNVATNVAIGGAGILLFSTAQEAVHKFSGTSAGRDISGVQKKINTEENKIVFWDSILPQVYGDLLEMYGDAKGRARMGLGHNEKLTGSWLDLLREDQKAYSHSDVQRWAKAIGKERATVALEKITQATVEERKPNDAVIAQAIAKQYGLEEVKLESPAAKSGKTIDPIKSAEDIVIGGDFSHRARTDWADQLRENKPNFPEIFVASLKNLLDEFEQTNRYECTPNEPTNVKGGFTLWLPPSHDKGLRQKALTVESEKITIHASQKDEVLVDSVRMAVQMFGGNFQVKNASPELLDKIKLITKDMLASSDVLVDSKGNKVTRVSVNGETIAPQVHNAISAPYRRSLNAPRGMPRSFSPA